MNELSYTKGPAVNAYRLDMSRHFLLTLLWDLNMVPMPILRSCLIVSVVCRLVVSCGFTESYGKDDSAISVTATDAIPEKIEYNRDVRPILADHCFACHGPDSASRKADLRLDDAKAAEEMGAVVPSNLDGSELVHRIRLPETDDLAMPPNTGHKRLTAQQRAILERWIEQGAVYQPHWSFLPPQRPALPSVTNEGWVRQPIDRFILASLEAKVCSQRLRRIVQRLCDGCHLI